MTTDGLVKRFKTGAGSFFGIGKKGETTTTNNQQPTTNNQQPTTNNQQPTTNNQQPTTNNQQPTTNNQQPTTNNQQPTTNNNNNTSNDCEVLCPCKAWEKNPAYIILLDDKQSRILSNWKKKSNKFSSNSTFIVTYHAQQKITSTT